MELKIDSVIEGIEEIVVNDWWMNGEWKRRK